MIKIEIGTVYTYFISEVIYKTKISVYYLFYLNYYGVYLREEFFYIIHFMRAEIKQGGGILYYFFILKCYIIPFVGPGTAIPVISTTPVFEEAFGFFVEYFSIFEIICLPYVNFLKVGKYGRIFDINTFR